MARKIYISGVRMNEDHIQDAWAYIKAGMKVEDAAASVLPNVKRINSIARTVYNNELAAVLNLKRRLFTSAFEEAKKGADWRRVFRGRKRIFWPSVEERQELGLNDFTRHAMVLRDPYRGKPMMLRLVVDHHKRIIEKVEASALDGRAAAK